MGSKLEEKDVNLVLAGFSLGGVIVGSAVYILMRKLNSGFVKRLVSNTNLKTELLNWVISDGMHLDRWEFEREFRERAQFLMMVENIGEG